MKILIYANGLVNCSVCADASMSSAEVEKEVNAINPSGVSPWGITKDNFADGQSNPKICEKDPAKKHYLLTC